MCIIFLGFDVMTLEILCQIDRPHLALIGEVSPLLDLLHALPDFAPSTGATYDLNQHESWRAFDPPRAAVDLLTQRIELLRVCRPPSLAMLSRGGVDSAPPMMMCALHHSDLETLLDALSSHLPAIAPLLGWLVVTTPAWREQAMAEPSLAPLLARRNPPLAPIIVRPGAHTSPNETMARRVLAPDATHPCTLHILSPTLRIEDAHHADHIAAAYERLVSA